MLHQTDGLSLQSLLRPLSVLLFHLLLIHSCRGQSQLIGSSQPIVATLGDDIILPCHLEPGEDAFGLTLEWTRPDLNRRFVYVRRSGQELVGKKHESFEGRTTLFIDELKMGNISLKLSKVTLADQGTYRCFIPLLGLETLVQLVAVSGAVSSPVITLAGIDEATSGVVLQCESAGWYPEPEVLWLDGEGKLVSVGPAETVRGPDDLYTVSSRVTVEKRHGNSFTCRVQQQNINQTRETHIHVPDDFFVQSSSSPVTVVLAVSLAVCIVFTSAVVFFVCKWRQKIKTKRSRSEETLMEGNRAAPASSSWLTSWNLYKWFKDEHQRRVEAETKLRDEKHRSENDKKQLLETKKQELQDEKTRREEAEEEVKNLKTELQTKVDRLTADVQKLKGEKEKSEKQLKKELETKNKKVESLKDVQKLKEEKEKSEKQLKKELETKNKELQDEKTRREEAEEEVKNLKTELQTKDNSSSSSLS